MTVDLVEGDPVGIHLPPTVMLEVVEADPVVKGQTAASSYKPAKLSNGVKTAVPPFIETGERIVVRTEDAQLRGARQGLTGPHHGAPPLPPPDRDGERRAEGVEAAAARLQRGRAAAGQREGPVRLRLARPTSAPSRRCARN